ncbi:MAG: NADH:ubiquinone oxidoreductase [Candidatus Omnitrophica bacterium CG12_big_fil_rev_8_21_14_0_65_43_15]|uniref:NADH:ubiquinone oxidoreductase n=1 Tax=Candidatus Taenaricola geysiri TaxID=1974752 RepID=A0A2J0LG02_9BACT|nr:MAG: NADH:ubiquinone oxidoreductase [Candidatus Omnitrophica bacterium CG10_big_fil_rev_8_21_14_0_10_43_8]PIV11868.1 MAG: NADH:ubiquinone oxidoreductase [Candidatus Omnitrophica bacterium CG03_land_8_20_14_0_80_43_22]PIW66768.1 MAG: NADH:ubiquinone oxidoreductase [Candidatus Omnitrophica bacterium CG12_big_fil_rev_8_21_14_0_65_43_15]PIY84095.1 MAG: NADH:ubiquinone oxidoreductase [Candidatus Omnitrophica bacterium CG_4_10_14_0_8_um_filter_43_18]
MSDKKKIRQTVIPIGPFHPLQEEPEFFKLFVDGETVTDIEINIGYNHRGIEKISEVKSFDQVTFLVERICGICSNSHPFAYCLAIEDLMGIEAPERASFIRTVIAELERIHSHLLWLGLAGHFLGYNTVFMWAWKYREPVLDIFEAITGNRNHYAMNKPGGVRRDIIDDDIPAILKMVSELVPAMDMFKGAIIDDPVIHARLKGVGILTKKDAIAYAALGPVARASGFDVDIRRDEPYGAYDRVKWNVIVEQDGDVFAKAKVRILEIYESIKIINQCLKKMPKGPIDANIKEVPPGEGIGRIEAPRGECIHYVRSDGSNSPVRHKIRAPSFMSVPTAKASIVGQQVADASIILAAADPCYCCTERMAVIDKKTNKQVLSAQDLVRMGQEKTRKLWKP